MIEQYMLTTLDFFLKNKTLRYYVLLKLTSNILVYSHVKIWV